MLTIALIMIGMVIGKMNNGTVSWLKRAKAVKRRLAVKGMSWWEMLK